MTIRRIYFSLRPALPDVITFCLHNRLRSPAAKTLAYRTPVPPQRWHFTTLSPFFSRPLPSQFLHFCFFLMLGPFWLVMTFSWLRCVNRGDARRSPAS